MAAAFNPGQVEIRKYLVSEIEILPLMERDSKRGSDFQSLAGHGGRADPFTSLFLLDAPAWR
jgi:hypothetical protein